MGSVRPPVSSLTSGPMAVVTAEYRMVKPRFGDHVDLRL